MPPYNIALVHASLGDMDNALLYLQRAQQEKDVQLVFLGVESRWDPLRNDARFMALAKRMKLSRP